MSDKLEEHKEVTDKLVAVATTGTAASAAAGATAAGATGLAVFWAMFPAAVGMCIWAGFEWRKQRAKRWWDKFVESSENKTTEELQGIIDANKDEPWVRETVLESVRRLLESVCDESAEVLGSLSAEYLREKRPPDAFFRGVARLVADLDAEELAELRELVSDLHDMPVERFTARQMIVDNQLVLRVLFQSVGAPTEANVDSPATANDEKYQDVTSPASFYRLCHLLKVNQLAKEGVGGVFNAVSGPHVMVVERAMFERLYHHVIGSPT